MEKLFRMSVSKYLKVVFDQQNGKLFLIVVRSQLGTFTLKASEFWRLTLKFDIAPNSLIKLGRGMMRFVSKKKRSAKDAILKVLPA